MTINDDNKKTYGKERFKAWEKNLNCCLSFRLAPANQILHDLSEKLHAFVTFIIFL